MFSLGNELLFKCKIFLIWSRDLISFPGDSCIDFFLLCSHIFVLSRLFTLRVYSFQSSVTLYVCSRELYIQLMKNLDLASLKQIKILSSLKLKSWTTKLCCSYIIRLCPCPTTSRHLSVYPKPSLQKLSQLSVCTNFYLWCLLEFHFYHFFPQFGCFRPTFACKKMGVQFTGQNLLLFYASWCRHLKRVQGFKLWLIYDTSQRTLNMKNNAVARWVWFESKPV